jgi:two-component sensor histidine kinase
MGIGEQAASTLAMVIHELATNSVKYGALSCAEGSLDVSSRANGDRLFLIWAETGGPLIVGHPELTGFGSRLVARSVSSQLGGELAYDWQERGLVVTIGMRMDRLAT